MLALDPPGPQSIVALDVGCGPYGIIGQLAAKLFNWQVRYTGTGRSSFQRKVQRERGTPFYVPSAFIYTWEVRNQARKTEPVEESRRLAVKNITANSENVVSVEKEIEDVEEVKTRKSSGENESQKNVVLCNPPWFVGRKGVKNQDKNDKGEDLCLFSRNLNFNWSRKTATIKITRRKLPVARSNSSSV